MVEYDDCTGSQWEPRAEVDSDHEYCKPKVLSAVMVATLHCTVLDIATEEQPAVPDETMKQALSLQKGGTVLVTVQQYVPPPETGQDAA